MLHFRPHSESLTRTPTLIWMIRNRSPSSVPDPDLEINGGWGVGGGGQSPRPLDKRGAQWGSLVPPTFFGPFRSQFGLKIRGAHPGPLPWICH